MFTLSVLCIPFFLLFFFFCKGIFLSIHWKDWCWSWSSNTLATWCELTHWKRPWCWERLKAGGEGDDREWDGWMASPARWTWVWASSGCWWWTWTPAMLQSMRLQRVRHNWATELNWFIISGHFRVCRKFYFFKYEKQIVIIFPALLNDSLAEYLILLTFYFSSTL